jgi:hypothetical protein
MLASTRQAGDRRSAGERASSSEDESSSRFMHWAAGGVAGCASGIHVGGGGACAWTHERGALPCFSKPAKDEGLHASTCNFCSCVFVRHAIVSNHPACPSAVLPDAADRVTDRTDHPGGGASPACMVVMFVSDPQPFRAGDIRTQTRNLSLTPTTRHTQRPADPKFPTFGGFWLVPRTLPWSSTCRSLAAHVSARGVFFWSCASFILYGPSHEREGSFLLVLREFHPLRSLSNTECWH